MICMYLPSHGQDELECRFILDNMKEKNENDGKYNNDDERLSRDLKKHNWLINKLKERLDVSNPLISEKSSTDTDEKEVKKPQRVGRRRHSIATPSAKGKSVRNSETECSQEHQKNTDIHSGCEIIDYSLKRTKKNNYLPRKNLDHQKSPDNFVKDDMIYDLRRKRKSHFEIYDQINNSQRHNVNNICNDVVYDLSINKETQSEKKLKLYNDVETPVNYSPYLAETTENKPGDYSPNPSYGNISDLRKIRRLDKCNSSHQPKKMSDADHTCKLHTKKSINIPTVSETQNDQQIIKHNLAFAVPPCKEKVMNMRVQNITIKDKQKLDISVQTEEIFSVSQEDWNLLNFIKSKGMTQEILQNVIEMENIEINNNSQSHQNQSDTDSDNENGVINIHILRKLLEQSEKNKNILKKKYNLYNNNQQSNSDISKQHLKDEKNEEQKKITRMIDILMSEYDQRKLNNKKEPGIDSQTLHTKQRQFYNPITTPNDKNFVFDQNKCIKSDIVPVPKSRTFVPPKSEPTHLQLHNYPVSWSRQSVSPYEAETNLQLPYKYQHHNHIEIEALNRRANTVYGHKIMEYPQFSYRLQHRTPRHISPYANQPLNYFEIPRIEPNIHYGPVQQNNQYIMESPHHLQTIHSIWRDENMYMNLQKTSKSRTSYNEPFIRESILRESDIQKATWESEITNYPNTDWSKSK